MGLNTSKDVDENPEAAKDIQTVNVSYLKQTAEKCYNLLDHLESSAKSLDSSLWLQQNVVEKILKENQNAKAHVEGENSKQTPKGPDDPPVQGETDVDKAIGANADSKCNDAPKIEYKVIDGLLENVLHSSRESVLYQARCLVDSVETFNGLIEDTLRKWGFKREQKHAAIRPIQGSGRNTEEGDKCVHRSQTVDIGQVNSSEIAEQLAEMRHTINEKDDDIATLKASSDADNFKINSLLKEIEKLKTINEQKKRKYDDLHRDYQTLHDKHFKKQYNSSRNWMSTPRKTAFAQLFCPRRGELTSSVSAEVIAMLRSRFSCTTTDISLQSCETASQLSPDKPGIVLCINASRLGTDVANALQGIKLSSKLAVVILHHKDIHALPNQRSERVLTSPEYKNLGGIFDMAFLSGKGIYPCEMNSTAVENIVTFIGQHN